MAYGDWKCCNRSFACSGRYEGFLSTTQMWDIAAGIILVEEADNVTDFSGVVMHYLAEN